jgi:soluble lytic murein transglycosylase
MMKNHPWCLALLISIGALALMSALPEHRAVETPSIALPASPEPEKPIETLSLPYVLSKQDRELYEGIFRAQKKARWDEADALIRRLDNPLLVGYVLAERYRHRQYTSTPAELAEWLQRYHDHPQAYDVYQLAQSKPGAIKSNLASVKKPSTLPSAGGDSATLILFNDTPYAGTWQRAVAAWRIGNKKEAAQLFSAIALKHNELSSWQESAAAYWAYRAHNANGNKDAASRYLIKAAANPRSFYGIIASRELKRPLKLDAALPVIAEADVLEMIGEQPVRRTLALSQIGQSILAERELRVVFPQASDAEKWRLLALAGQLKLASVQIAMARQLDDGKRTLDFAAYPTPDWEPQEGFTVEPTLIYAMMRQESAFQAGAVSTGGAMGLMQLMPKTVSMMEKQIGKKDNAHEPEHNIALGQSYIRHLLDNELVEGNLIYMLTAYNAGPGRLQDWKQQAGNDPLLFVESIPFAETRAYVMQVMTNYWIYAELSGQPSPSVATLAASRWPYFGRVHPIADNTPRDRNG